MNGTVLPNCADVPNLNLLAHSPSDPLIRRFCLSYPPSNPMTLIWNPESQIKTQGTSDGHAVNNVFFWTEWFQWPGWIQAVIYQPQTVIFWAFDLSRLYSRGAGEWRLQKPRTDTVNGSWRKRRNQPRICGESYG